MELFKLSPSLSVGAVVADIDMTVIPDGHSGVAGLNCKALCETLEREIPVMLISGSPYDSVYCGVTTTGSLRRRVYLPLKAALENRGTLNRLRHLRIFYASGRGNVSFDPSGAEIRRPDRTDRDISNDQQDAIFRAFLSGFYAIQKKFSLQDYSNPVLEKIWTANRSNSESAESVRKMLGDEMQIEVGPLEKWAFGSELALVFHNWNSSGPDIARFAKGILNARGIPLPGDLFWAGGMDYSKASRIRKRDVIQEALSSLTFKGALVSFGDSNVDDFLTIKSDHHVPIFLGSATDVKNFPGAWLARDAAGRDRQFAAAFGPLLMNFLYQQWPADAGFRLER